MKKMQNAFMTRLLICSLILVKMLHGQSYKISSLVSTITSNSIQNEKLRVESNDGGIYQNGDESLSKRELLTTQNDDQNLVGEKRSLSKKLLKSNTTIVHELVATGDKRNSKRFNKKSLLKKLKLKKTPTKIKTIDGAKKTLSE